MARGKEAEVENMSGDVFARSSLVDVQSKDREAETSRH